MFLPRLGDVLTFPRQAGQAAAASAVEGLRKLKTPAPQGFGALPGLPAPTTQLPRFVTSD
jgi:hypothetical protein